MDKEQIFQQIIDAIEQKRSVGIADLYGLIVLGISAGTYASKCHLLNEFLTKVKAHWEEIKSR